MRVAIIGYCPPPKVLSKYNPLPTDDQYFIHVTPYSVQKCCHQSIEFLSLVHVYGGPVSASTVEELVFYGFDFILAYGLAGGLGTKNLKMGCFYLVESALVADGTTPHYTNDSVIRSDQALRNKIMALSEGTDLEGITPVQAITGDAIYKETDEFLNSARKKGCDIVNLDSSHLFAVSLTNADGRTIRTIECGVISDVPGGEGQKWDSNLSVMLSNAPSNAPNPLELTGKIVEFYIETLVPKLLAGTTKLKN